MNPEPRPPSAGEPRAGEPSARGATLATALGLVLVTAWGAWRRSVDLDPASLWLDDAWVAVLGRAASTGELLAHSGHSPPLFNLLVALFARMQGDPELGPQALPFLAGVALIPCTGLLAWRLTGRPVCALAAALLMAGDPLLILYSARVKQYSTDALLTLGHILALERLRARPSPGAAWSWAGLAVLGLGLSSASTFVVAACVAAALVHLRRDRHTLAACAALALVTPAVALLLLRAGSNQALTTWWAESFLPTHSPGALLGASWRAVAAWLGEPLHAPPASALALLSATLTALGATTWVRAGRGVLALAAGLLVPLLLVACALRLMPVGIERMERVQLFLLPLVVLLATSGLPALDRLRSPVWRRIWPAACLAALALHVRTPRAPTYPEQVSAPLVAFVAREKRPEDALLINDFGAYAFGWYGPWPLKFNAYPAFGTGFLPVPELERARVIPTSEALLDASLAAALADRPPRVLVFLCHHYGLDQAVPAAARRAGWRVAHSESRPACVVLVLVPG